MALNCCASTKNAARLRQASLRISLRCLAIHCKMWNRCGKLIIRNMGDVRMPGACASRFLYGSNELSSGVTLLFPGVAIDVITVAFPESEAVFIVQLETAHPLDA